MNYKAHYTIRREFIWKTEDGVEILLMNISDRHLNNIKYYLVNLILERKSFYSFTKKYEIISDEIQYRKHHYISITDNFKKTFIKQHYDKSYNSTKTRA